MRYCTTDFLYEIRTVPLPKLQDRNTLYLASRIQNQKNIYQLSVSTLKLKSRSQAKPNYFWQNLFNTWILIPFSISNRASFCTPPLHPHRFPTSNSIPNHTYPPPCASTFFLPLTPLIGPTRAPPPKPVPRLTRAPSCRARALVQWMSFGPIANTAEVVFGWYDPVIMMLGGTDAAFMIQLSLPIAWFVEHISKRWFQPGVFAY